MALAVGAGVVSESLPPGPVGIVSQIFLGLATGWGNDVFPDYPMTQSANSAWSLA
jgi:hypothetical protein